MSDFHLESLEQCFSTLKTDMTLAEFADLAESAALSASQIAAVSFVFEHLRKKKIETTIQHDPEDEQTAAEEPEDLRKL